jgi:thiol:disulfide interchange protein DsbC
MMKSFLLAGLLFASASHAAEIPKAVSQLAQELGISDVRPTPAAGLYELLVGTQIFYITADGKYLLAGNMLDMTTKENLTDTRMKGVRLDALGTVKDDQLIAYKSKKPEHTITIFTDIDCGYCRKLHSEMADYNKLGISVKYLFYPRTGPGTDSYNKAVSVWCNKDRNAAMNDAKAGKSVAAAKCSNPVASHFKLGTQMGLSGTPFMITEYGDTLPGYLPPSALKGELDKMRAAATDKSGLEKKSISKR